jgi:hypothetical protein
MIARMGSATARAPLEKSEQFKAPLFESLLDQLAAPRRWIALDLGAASTAMLELLGKFRTRVEIADLPGCGGIDMLNAETNESRLAEIAEFVLPKHDDPETIDIVFCWDMLNYLRPAGIAALTSAIEKRCRPGTLAHGLVVYADSDMPARPGRYRPTLEGKLTDARRPTDLIPAPRYSPEDLSQTMGQFAIERAMLLSNGMQEFLFRLQKTRREEP